MITFGAGSDTVFPFAHEAKVICALPAYVVIAQMTVKNLWVEEGFSTVEPLTVMRRRGFWRERLARGGWGG
jgi:hypothetical protein